MKSLITLLLLCASLPAQVYKVEAYREVCQPNGCTTYRGEGTCVSIGADEQYAYFLTAAHVVKDRTRVVVKDGGKEHAAEVLAQEYSNQNDIAVLGVPGMECRYNFYLTEDKMPEDGKVLIGCRKGGNKVPRAVSYKGDNWFECSQMVCIGDSGGPIVTPQGRVVGIANSVDHIECGRNVRCTTNVAQWVRQNCPQGYCVLPQYRVTPVAPARPRVVIDPPQYRVEPLAPRPLQEPLPDTKPKPEPKPALTIDYNKLADVMVARHGDRLRGERGPAGPAGQDGANGEAGTSPSETELRAAIAAHLQANPLPSPSLPNRRFLIVDGKNIIDDEVYGPDEPVILDVRKLVRGE